MWGGELGEHCKVLAGAEPTTQALRFLSPYFSESRPKGFDQIHLVAVLDDTAAQVMQMLGVGIDPIIGDQLSCTAIGRGEPIRYGIEVDGPERPPIK